MTAKLADHQDGLPADDQAKLPVSAVPSTQFAISSSDALRRTSPRGGELIDPQDRTIQTFTTDDVVFGPLETVGVWRWKPKEGAEETLPVNLLSRAESAIGVNVEGGEPISIPAGSLPPTPRHGWFLALALVAWFSEWIAFALGVTE